MTQLTTDTPPVTAPAPLTATDRCDACGAQAYVRATLATGELLFCAHHASRFSESLKANAIAWHDETAKLHGEA